LQYQLFIYSDCHRTMHCVHVVFLVLWCTYMHVSDCKESNNVLHVSMHFWFEQSSIRLLPSNAGNHMKVFECL